MAWLPVPILLAAVVGLRIANPHTQYESADLAWRLNFLTRTLASLLIMILAGRSFLVHRAPGLLLLGCGVAIWGAAGFVASTFQTGDANFGITVTNLAAWLSGVCHLAGAVFFLRSQRTVRSAAAWLGAGYAIALGAVGLLAMASLAGWLPTFFVNDHGTPVRHMVLISAIALFVLTAVLLWEAGRPLLCGFAWWYTLGLLMIAVGLFGMIIQSHRYTPLDWAGRATQYIGGVYMLIAAFASRRDAGLARIRGNPERMLRSACNPYGMAIAMVLAAAALRLALLDALGTRVAFITFYPAVILAALYGGLWAGLLAALLSAVAVDFFWIGSLGLDVGDAGDWLAIAVFLTSCAMICALTGAMHRAQARAANAQAEARTADERMRAAEVLRQSEERYRALFDTLIEGFCIVEVLFDTDDKPVDGRFLETNTAFEAQTGLRDVRGRRIRELTPDNEPIWFETFGKVARTGEPARLVSEARALGRWFDVKAYRVDEPAQRRVAILFNDITEAKRSEEALRQSREDLDRAQAFGQSGSWRLDVGRNVLTWSDENHRMFGIPQGTPLSYETFLGAVHPDDRQYVDSQWNASLGGEPYDIEHRIVVNGQTKWVREKAYLEFDDAGKLLGGFGITQDITERKRAEREREITVEFLHLVNTHAGVRDLVEASVGFLRQRSGCEAVGIRLRDGDDYPYYETHGFPEEFVRLENSLCCRGEDGRIERDSAGDPVLACMCGNVICGRFDPAKPFFTPRGSFWANDTTRLLAITTDADRQARTHNRCNGEGYESVALIALQVGEQRMGLLQLNDRRRNMFTPEMIALWERLAGYLAVALARARAEEALQHSEERLRLFVEHAPAAVAMFDREMRYLAVSRRWLADYGLGEGDIVGRSHYEVFPEAPQRWKEIHQRCLAGAVQKCEEEAFPRGDGRMDWVRWEVHPWRGGDGAIGGIILFSEVITERKQAELDQELATEVLRALNCGGDDLRELIRQVLRLIQESTGFDAVGLRVRDGDDCPYYQQDGFSEEFLREEKFLCAKGGDGSILRDAQGRPVLECTCGLVLSGRADLSLPFFTPGGSFWTNRASDLLSLPLAEDPRTNPRNNCIHKGYESVALMPVRCGERIVGLLQLNDRQPGRFTRERIRFFEGLAGHFGLALQRQQAEEDLKAAKISAEQAKAEAEKANAAKDQFLAVLSHELRTPLTPVLLTASLLEQRKDLPADLRADMHTIRRSVELEARIIDDLLDLTRIARGKMAFDMRSIDLHLLVRSAADICSHGDGAPVKLELGARRHTVQGDAGRLQQVLWNLLTNARKFTPADGTITVRSLDSGSTHVRVEVADSGSGIEPEFLSKVFDAFEQAPASRQHGGLGLGLAISKAIVDAHGGRIMACSGGKGQGSTFIVELQATAPMPLPAPAAVRDGDGPPQRALSILLVEDHEFTRKVMGRLIADLGHTVHAAGSVAAAKAVAGRQALDVVISDLGLPDGTGHELMAWLKERYGLRGVALSGYGMEEDVQRSREAGFLEHLTKPVDAQHLRAVIARLGRA